MRNRGKFNKLGESMQLQSSSDVEQMLHTVKVCDVIGLSNISYTLYRDRSQNKPFDEMDSCQGTSESPCGLCP